ncbi:NmrA family NAD(P)-binding protein [Pseudodesulfovibrio piezophilus]|uniref:NmrA family protein n=1 Tax=Pseudodesulfovibrio piezophilus (strain DSM 21447 / JCM 15486 / C1TLV30) TaxID=1322246 RepID=M1WM54_PSEP2|nr:NmrA family NAD(P)-binding protein [Pseudodesulfovibrio piezophilus]CCH49010.1 NmrA family protein [Pseudodesulfovibrio piezophilus C1TLV30]
MSRIFVAGASGNIGAALLAALHVSQAEVVAGVHDPDKAKALKELDVDARLFDFQDPDSLARAMEGCQRMFLVLPMVETMTRFGHLAVQAAKQVGIEYIVRSSGYAASSDAHWRLGREHGMVDQFVEDSGIPFTILRPNTFMQNFASRMAGMVRSGVLALPEEAACVSYIDVRDVAACAAALLLDPGEHENRSYALTGPEGLSGAEVADRIGKAVGQDILYQPISEEEFIKIQTECGLGEWQRSMLVSLSRVVKLGMMGNVTKAVEHLTGTPARAFETFAAENVTAWK